MNTMVGHGFSSAEVLLHERFLKDFQFIQTLLYCQFRFVELLDKISKLILKTNWR